MSAKKKSKRARAQDEPSPRSAPPPLPPRQEATGRAWIDDPMVLAIVLAVVFAGLVALTWKSPTRGGGPLSAVPRESFLVARVDAAALRRSPIFAAVAGEGDASRMLGLSGLSELAQSCGFDPLTRVRELAVTVPEGESRGTFGIAAQVDLTESELATCSQRLIERRGGETKPKEVGHFHVLEEQKGSHPGLAFREGGLLLVAEGAWLAAMMATAEGARPAAGESEDHGKLGAALTEGPGWSQPTVLVTALLPKPLRDRLKGELEGELAAATRAPGGEDPPAAVMAAVLSVSRAGLALKAGAPGEDLEARVELGCETEQGCVVVQRLIERKRLGWSKDIGYRLVGLGPLIDSLTADAHGAALTARAKAPSDDLGRALRRVLDVSRSRRQEPGSASPSPARSPPSLSPRPDEIVGGQRARDGGAAPRDP